MARLTADDWFTHARRLLVAQGHEALTVDGLTAVAGVTKGSFYHHFKGHSGFVEAFLADVCERAFADVVTEVDARAPAREQLRQLVRAIARHDPALERAVRRWAATDPAPARLVEQVDADRLAYVEDLLQQVTGDPVAARSLARLNYAFYVGCLHVEPPVQGEEYVAMTVQLERLLPPDDAA